MDEQFIYEGFVNSVIFHNSENGYSVFSLETNYNDENDKNNENNQIICVGTIPLITEGENIKVTGSFVMHPSYGKQLNILVYEKSIPTKKAGIERYLASGVIKGIDPKIASKIVAEFGEKTFEIFEKEPEKLSKIRGITRDKALSMGAVFKEQCELRQAMLYLQDYGITPNYALKIYKRFKEKTVKAIQENPYVLADEIFGISFKTSDKIAEKIGIAKESSFRIEAGIKFILNKEASNGNVYLPMDTLVKIAVQLLNVPSEIIENIILELNVTKKIWVEENAEMGKIVFLNFYFYSENFVAKKLVELSLAEVADADD